MAKKPQILQKKQHGNRKTDLNRLEELVRKGVKQYEIAQIMNVSNAAVSRGIDKLEELGTKLRHYQTYRDDILDETVRRCVELLNVCYEMLAEDNYQRLRNMTDANLRNVLHTLQGGLGIVAAAVRQEKGIEDPERVILGLVDLTRYQTTTPQNHPQITHVEAEVIENSEE